MSPSSKRVLKWISGGVLVLTGILAAYQYFFLKGPSLSERVRNYRNLSEDRKKLARSDTKEHDVFVALMRLAQRQDPKARDEAIRRSEDASSMVRLGAAEALGYYTDETAFYVLKKLLNDEEESVRARALRTLGRQPGSERMRAVESYLAKPGITETERYEALFSLFSLSLKHDEKERAYRRLIEYVLEGHSSLREKAGVRLVQIGDGKPEVLNMVRDKILRSESPEIIRAGTRYLCSHDSAGVLQVIDEIKAKQGRSPCDSAS